VRDRAYAPYSRFHVGAALLADDDEVFTGANVENASYPVSMCAERSALFAAIAQGHRKFRAIAIAGPDGVRITPCGACRQALSEFGTDLVILREGRDDVSLREILPDPFDHEALERARV
jgi:cytidine deaminase